MQQVKDVLQIIDELEKLISQARLFRGRAIIDEEVFFDTSARLKKAIPETIKKAEACVRRLEKKHTGEQAPPRLNTYRFVDELEHMVETSPTHLFGKTLVNKTEFMARLVKMRQGLTEDVSRSEQLLKVYPDEPESVQMILDDARQQAQRIIEEAEQEAARIIAKAKQQAP
ncbi:MAG: hypothetical protein JO316_07435 [Abitibacteriaceae bacterium]|nr:hypothetical protein [Abditibacteriaceae bacterium]MBV9865168.1 hypothetical protein [Abditibacteriaceae bacterium]